MSSPNFGDYLVAGAGGAAQGFFDNQVKENEAAKLAAEQERQTKLLLLKDEMASRREMAKQKDQQAFEMQKLVKTQEFTAGENQKERAQKLVDAASKNEFEMQKLGAESSARMKEAEKKHGYDVEIEGIRSDKRSEDRVNKARTDLRKEFQKAVAAREKDAFGDQSKAPLEFTSWAKETYPELYAEAFPDGSTSTEAAPADGGGKFDSIFSKVTGAASRTKQGANDAAVPAAPAARAVLTESTRSDLPPAAVPSTTAASASTTADLPPVPQSPVVEKLPGVRTAKTSIPSDIESVIAAVESGKLDTSRLATADIRLFMKALEGRLDRRGRDVLEELRAELRSR